VPIKQNVSLTRKSDSNHAHSFSLSKSIWCPF